MHLRTFLIFRQHVDASPFSCSCHQKRKYLLVLPVLLRTGAEELAAEEVGLADTNLMLVIRVRGAEGVAPHMGPLAI